MLEKRGQRSTTQAELSEITFKVNCINQPSGRGSAAERFLRRRPKSLLPGSMEAHIDHQEMVKKRYEHQLNLSKKKGRSSIDQFELGDRVVIQSPDSGKWEETGIIEKKRVADDNSTQSFEIQMDNGSVKLRNRRFLKHATKGPDRHVQINPNVEHDHEEDGAPATAPGNLFLSPVLTQDRAEERGLTLEPGPGFSQSSPLHKGYLSLSTLLNICEVPDTQKQTLFSSFLFKK